MELVKIDPQDYGLTEEKAKQISGMFKPMLDKMEALEKEFNEVAALKINPETCLRAHQLRLKYVEVRTGTAAIHKELKAFYLQGGRYVDGWKNAQIFASQGTEEKLKTIEQHYENLEREKIVKLQDERAEQLKKYEVEAIPETLGAMGKEVWANYLTGVKVHYDNMKLAEKKAEEERVAREKAEAEEQERIRLDNIRLQKEAEARERKEKRETKKREKAEAERLKKVKAEQVQREKEEADRLKKEAKERKRIQVEADKKLKAERDQREKAERELQAKADAEKKAKHEKEARIQAELNKGDKDKVRDLIQDLESLGTKYKFESKKNQKMYNDTRDLIAEIVSHIKIFKHEG